MYIRNKSILDVGASTYLFLIALSILAAYVFELAEANEYIGYFLFPIDLPYIVTSALAIFAIGKLMPKIIRKPSDFLTCFYGLFILLPFAVLYPIRNTVNTQQFIFIFFTIFFPLLAFRVLSVTSITLNVPNIVKEKKIVFLITMLCIVGALLALLNPPMSAGFDIETSYDRRLQGRDIYSTGTLMAYAIAAIVNGFAPFLAFVAVWQRRILLFGFSLSLWLVFYYLLGLKAPLLYICIASLIGYSVRVDKSHLIIKYLYIILLIIFTLFFVEYFLFEYSFINDYFIRRAFSVPPWLISAYFEFMTSSSSGYWYPLQGVDSAEPISMIIGEEFLGYPGLNANTNAFVYQLAANGVVGYVFTIFLVLGVYVLLDATYARKRNPALLYLGFAYAILLVEQAATTALVSSGIGMLIAIVIFSGNGYQVKKFSKISRGIINQDKPHLTKLKYLASKL
ncbi:MAG: hypothetical protein CVU29_05890 [Betaproteobacteria bacterium HGW-Betaproteobacteria-22]|nr:MAG: hypothetical protein CVU29_05890 [Betaproteobacteria bacterium HGW-Betaproteobacteria-22]